ncbi:MAG: hypothetical protein FJ320_02025 [SAR202 cluster bacterium]|nr:hypothetical protein [SAR202 cluster bacterium]
MSKRKDRERFLAQRRVNPDYTGFRGRGAPAPSPAPTEAVTCSRCGRKRNVAANVAAQAQKDGKYICSICQDELAAQQAASPTDPSTS